MMRRRNLLCPAAGILAGFILGSFAATHVWQSLIAGAGVPEWVHFVVFGVAVIFSIMLSGFLAGLAGAVVSGLILRRLRLLLWAAMWLAGSTGLSLTVLGRGADPAVGLAAGGWRLLLGILLALLFYLPALLQRRSFA